MLLLQDIEAALLKAFHVFEAIRSEEYVPNVETSRSVVFNSAIDFALMKLHRERGLSFWDIKNKEPRMFSQLLANYLVDLRERDLIYSIRPYTVANDQFGFSFEALTFAPELIPKDFTASRDHLIESLKSVGNAVYSPYGHMIGAEAFMNNFTSRSAPFRIKFGSYVSLAERANVTSHFADFIHFGIGYIGSRVPEVRTAFKSKKNFQGSFLYYALRGRIESKKKLLQAVFRLVNVLQAVSVLKP